MYNNNINHTMTVEDLATAITRVPDYAYLERKESLKLSHRVLNYFGYGGRLQPGEGYARGVLHAGGCRAAVKPHRIHDTL